MIDPTSPEAVLPLAADAAESLYEALRTGVGYADTLQPEFATADPYFWSHSARFSARQELRKASGESWRMVAGVANSGIHLLVRETHAIRVVKSLDRTVPHPGANHARREAWVGVNVQQRLPLDPGAEDAIVPLSLIADWHIDPDREPIVYLSLPVAPWKYRENPRCYWRVALPPGGSLPIGQLPGFPGGDDGDVTIDVDPAEWAVE